VSFDLRGCGRRKCEIGKNERSCGFGGIEGWFFGILVWCGWVGVVILGGVFGIVGGWFKGLVL
jgi:hypothetical protein